MEKGQLHALLGEGQVERYEGEDALLLPQFFRSIRIAILSNTKSFKFSGATSTMYSFNYYACLKNYLTSCCNEGTKVVSGQASELKALDMDRNGAENKGGVKREVRLIPKSETKAESMK